MIGTFTFCIRKEIALSRLAPKLSLLLVAAALAGPPLDAQVASLVADLNDDPVFGFGPSSDPRFFVQLPGRVVFVASDPNAGLELWTTDATSHGTELLADICPGGCSSDPFPLGAAGGVSFWSVEDEDRGFDRSLWRSDGTRAGTYRLAPGVALPGSPSSTAREVAVVGNRLFFVGCEPGVACELWRSDGTPAGTRAVGVAARQLTWFTAVGDKLFFVGQEENDVAVWVSDGTPGGTSLLRRFEYPYPRALVGHGTRLFFIAAAQGSAPFTDDLEVWVSDGTSAGTRQASQLTPDSALATTEWLRPLGGFVYFIADDVIHGQEIWRSDGTATGTRRVTDFGYHLPLGSVYGGDIDPRSLEELGGNLLFLASDGLTPPKLWTTDGEPTSTAPLADACTSPCPDTSIGGQLLKAGGRVYFPASDDEHGAELWATDGTAAGTALIRDVCPGPCSGSVSGALLAGGKVLFIGMHDGFSRRIWRTDGTPGGTRPFSELVPDLQLTQYVLETVALGEDLLFSGTGPQGNELWASDGRPGGTRLVRDLAVGPPASSPSHLIAAGDALLFRACDGRSAPFWRSGGSAETTFPLAADGDFSCYSSSGLSLPARANGLVFFWENTYSGPELWRTDGTPEGTVLVVRFDFDVDLDRTRLAVIGGAVYFNIGYRFSNPPQSDEIWKSDGTPQGTGPAVDLGGETRYISQLSAAGGALYFVGDDEDEGQQVWRSDGTSVGTELLRSGGLNLFSPLFTAAGPFVYFVAEETDGYRTTLWVTDGTSTGTHRVVQLTADFYDDPVQLISFRGALYFFAPLAAGYGLWTTDGTEAGTGAIRMFQLEGELHENYPFLTVVGERLFFRASDGASGRELWASDGTAAGTYLVADIVPGSRSADPTQLAVAGGKLFFRVHDGVHGFELWTSDGTAAGTLLVHDIAPGAASSYPEQLTAAGNRLYFSADDGLTGRELWSLDLSAPAGVCAPSSTALCLGGRFRVEALWKDFDRNTGTGRTVPLTADTGAFWFFGPENVEVILKVLDGRGLNQHHWVFYGALSSVEYALTVTDVQTGITARYWNPSGQLASVADTTGFGPLGAFSVVERSTSGPPPRARVERVTAAAAVPCVPAPTRLCLRGGRFSVEATWKDFSGNAGVGTGVALTGDTGYFWFFGADNVEVVLKVLDGRPLNGKHWVFYGALSSVEYTLRVTDTATGKVKTYMNPGGNLASVADTGAF